MTKERDELIDIIEEASPNKNVQFTNSAKIADAIIEAGWVKMPSKSVDREDKGF